MRRLASEIRVRSGAAFVVAFRTAHVVFLLAPHDTHYARFQAAIAFICPPWGEPIEPVVFDWPA